MDCQVGSVATCWQTDSQWPRWLINIVIVERMIFMVKEYWLLQKYTGLHQEYAGLNNVR